MNEVRWDIRRKGRRYSREESDERWPLLPEKLEEVDGKVLTCDEDRLAMLAIMLENVGMDCALQLGDLDRWREAIGAAGEKK